MLELKNIKKHYIVGETVTKALDNVSVSFRKTEFVSILGTSGSGKTTLLNIIGGLDNYDDGDIIINGSSTKSFEDADWDAYRNNSIGFIFQSYNLIGHLGIIDNVELGMTLSGVSKEERKKKAEEALIRVGLKDHMHKKPNQLSGGQMQRVAIARALANNPDILLCDEPTGALDSETSIQIMELIKELSNEKLVIMVTHNPELAHEYTNRIIEVSDGHIISDSQPFNGENIDKTFSFKRTKMSFKTALRLSFNNIKTKKGRTFLTSFASSIGIIGIAVVLSLSTGFQTQIDETQSKTLSQFPITITQVTTEMKDIDRESMTAASEFPDKKTFTVEKSQQDAVQYINKINEEFVDYISEIDPELSQSIGYGYSTSMNLIREVDETYKSVMLSNVSSDSQGMGAMNSLMSSASGVGISTFPHELTTEEDSFLEKNYSLLSGRYPETSHDILLVVDGDNVTNINALKNLGFDVKEDEEIKFDEIVGTELKLVDNNDFYNQLPTKNFIPNAVNQEMYENTNNITLTISGVIRIKSDSTMDLLASGFAYSDTLSEEIMKANEDSEIVKAQEESDISVLTNEELTADTKKQILSYLGAKSYPNSIYIYPNNFESKDQILDYLDSYNKDQKSGEKIIYTDMAGTMTSLTGGIMDAITYVLIAFAAISLVTSMIMVSIITYTSVIERTKEIGVLKALGARKKDITRVFDAETFIIGMASGTLGVIIAWLLTYPINMVLYNMTELENVANLNPLHALALVVVSTILTILGGHIPARMAAQKDAAIALRAE
ncbi:MAG: ATP-binding cassette domain-containing protein [Lactovum sp.]